MVLLLHHPALVLPLLQRDGLDLLFRLFFLNEQTHIHQQTKCRCVYLSLSLSLYLSLSIYIYIYTHTYKLGAIYFQV